MACMLTLFVLLALVPFGLGRHAKKMEKEQEDLKNERLPMRVTTPEALQLSEGSAVALECQAAGDPLPTLHWRKNGRCITTPQVWESCGAIGGTIGRLYLECVGVEDQGEYECVAEGADTKSSTTTLTVVPASSSAAADTCKRNEDVARIVSWSRTVVQTQGEEVRLWCQVTGSPVPEISWLDPDNKTIATTHHKYTVSAGGEELRIRDLTWSDLGNYACVAKNQHGSDREVAFVYPARPED